MAIDHPSTSPFNNLHLDPTTNPAGRFPVINRRGVLGAGIGLAGAAVLLGACGGSEESITPEPDKGGKPQLIAMFPRDVAYLAAGIPARLIYTMLDAEGVPADKLPDNVSFTISQDGTKVGEPATARVHTEKIPRPYLSFPFTFPNKGVYDVSATIDGNKLNSTVIVVDPSEVKMPVIGQPLPSAPTPTTTNTLEVDPLCTLVPQCPFHEHNLADVIGTGKPIVLLLATPAYCQTTACGPILETLMTEAKALPPETIVIHTEVYKNPTAVDDLNDATLAPLPEAYNMAFEPSLFVANSAGILVARGDIVVDAAEMREMLALAS